jgi:hypothetical protein
VRLLLLLAAVLILVACGQQPASVLNMPACSGTENLLRNPEFALNEQGRRVAWQGAQHAGEPSFLLNVEQGVATVQRIGSEPWYNFEQFPDAKPYIGHEMLLKADLKLDLNDDDWTHSMTPGGGLQVLIWQTAVPAIAGSRLIFESAFEHEPHIGTTDWFTVGIKFRIPERVSRMKVGFVHKANGSLSFRNPALLDCGPAADSVQDEAEAVLNS